MQLLLALAIVLPPETPIRSSVDRVVARMADEQVGAPRGFDGRDVSTPPPRRGESFFSAQNLLLGAGIAVTDWWDVKTSKDCFRTPPVVVGNIRYSCVETNPRMAAKFAQGDGAVYRYKALVHGAVWVGSWGIRRIGWRMGGPYRTIGNIVGYVGPAGTIGFNVRVSLGNISARHELERKRR